MCYITSVLETLKNKRTITNRDVLAIAEAQAKDTLDQKKERNEMVGRMAKLEEDMAIVQNTLAEHGAKLDLLLKEVRSSQEDAGRYRLLVDIWRALFGSTKKTITTFVIVGVIIGLINMKDVLELFRVLI